MHIVLCYIECDGKVLLLKRNNEPYSGYYALPGGKVEKGESALLAAERETVEESGLVAVSASLLAESAEEIVEEGTGSILYSYNMSLVKIEVEKTRTTESVEGELCWFDLNDFLNSRDIVPTDIDLVRRYYLEKYHSRVHYSVVKRRGGEYCISSID